MLSRICILSSLLSAIALMVACDGSSGAGRDAGAANNATDAAFPGDAGVDAVNRVDGGMDAAVAPGGDGEAADTSCERRVLVNEVTNARDLGGWPLAGGGRVACRKVFRGGALDLLGDAGCAEFAALGIRAVVDLRESVIQQASPPTDCVTARASNISAPMPKLLPDTTDSYLALLNEAEAVRLIFGVLGDAASYPVYYGCEIGRARASFVTALILLALEADRQTVEEEYMLSSEAGVAVKVGYIDAVLDEIEKRGGIEKYLSDCNVSSDAIDVLREQVIVEK